MSYIDYLRPSFITPLSQTMDLGRTLPKKGNPAEPAYLDPGFGSNVVQPGSKQLVPSPDGTFFLEAMDAHGGLISSAPDLIRFFSAYWMNGTPRQRGTADFEFIGSLPGTHDVTISG